MTLSITEVSIMTLRIKILKHNTWHKSIVFCRVSLWWVSLCECHNANLHYDDCLFWWESLCSVPLCLVSSYWLSLCLVSLCWLSWRHLLRFIIFHWILVSPITAIFRAEFANQMFQRMSKLIHTSGISYWRGRLNTVDLLALTSLEQLHYLLKILFNFFYKTCYLLNEEVNCT